MEMLWLIIENERQSVHDQTSLTQICLEKVDGEFNREEIEAQLQLDGLSIIAVLKSEDEAQAFRKNWHDRSTRDYTKVVNKMEDLELVQDRSFLVHLDEDVTEVPRLYQIQKQDYEKLKKAYPSVRLASDDETDAVESYTSCFIATDYEKLEKLSLSDLRALARPAEIRPDRYYDLCQRFDESQELLDDLRSYCINLARENKFVKKEKAVAVAEKLFKDKAEATVDRLVAFFRALVLGETPELFELPPVQYEKIDEIDYGAEKVNIECA